MSRPPNPVAAPDPATSLDFRSSPGVPVAQSYRGWAGELLVRRREGAWSMKGLVYTDSAGERVKDPDAKFVQAALRGECHQRGSYAPEGELTIGNPARSCLLISRHPSWGWYLEFSKYEEPEQKLVGVQPGGDREAWVEHWMGGETSYFLAACFVPQTLADQAVAEFMTSGK